MTHERSSLVATLVGVGLTLTTAAAAELGAPRGLWIAAGIAGLFSFGAALMIHIRRVRRASQETSPKLSTSTRRLHLPSPRKEQVTAVMAILVLAIAVFIATRVDFVPEASGVVIVCIDSSASTNSVRATYLPDLTEIVRQAALREQTFYASDCGVNATGSVNWPIRKKFGGRYYAGRLARSVAARQAAGVVVALTKLVKIRSDSQGTPLGEILAVMARQCGEAGGNCTIYLFTDGEWADEEVKVSDGLDNAEWRNYLKSYLPQLADLADSKVNFVGVGYGTSMGELHLGEARSIARELVQGAGGEMGAWTTRL